MLMQNTNMMNAYLKPGHYLKQSVIQDVFE
jgi:hypothetical protein